MLSVPVLLGLNSLWLSDVLLDRFELVDAENPQSLCGAAKTGAQNDDMRHF